MPHTPRAIVLAAGRGSRMLSLTADRPKCLVELAGRPLLEWQLAAIRSHGITDVAVVTGYLAGQLEGRGLQTFHNPRWAETNIVRSLERAAAWLDASPCFVSYGDIVYHPNHLAVLETTHADLAVAYDTLWLDLWRMRSDDPLADAETFCEENGRLIDVGRRARSGDEIHGQYLGLLRFTPDGWRRLARRVQGLPTTDGDRLDMTSALRLLLEDGCHIGAHPVHGGWVEVDTDLDRDLFERRLSDRLPWAHDWRPRSLGGP